MANNVFFDTINQHFDDALYLTHEMGSVFDERYISSILSDALKYYIYSKNSSLDVYSAAKKYIHIGHKRVKEKEIQALIEEGYLTHTCNGQARRVIEKIGFGSFNTEEYSEINNSLIALENAIGPSFYYYLDKEKNKKYGLDNLIYLSNPGFSSIYYALNGSPERLFLGLLNQNNSCIEMVVGESRENYIYRVLASKLKEKQKEFTFDEYDYLIKCAKIVALYYGKYLPSVFFIPISEMINKKISTDVYDGKTTYKELIVNPFINAWYREVEDYFTKSAIVEDDDMHKNNLVTLMDNMPEASELSYIDFPDMYTFKQSFANVRKYSLGECMDYYSCIRSKKDGSKVLENDIALVRKRG